MYVAMMLIGFAVIAASSYVYYRRYFMRIRVSSRMFWLRLLGYGTGVFVGAAFIALAPGRPPRHGLVQGLAFFAAIMGGSLLANHQQKAKTKA